ncbi:MAG: hypothetical protein ACLFWD_11180 [Anaerolineales bacterium]
MPLEVGERLSEHQLHRLDSRVISTSELLVSPVLFILLRHLG